MTKVSTTEDWCVSPRPLALQLLRQPSELSPEGRDDLLDTIHERLIPQLLLAHWEEPDAAVACPDTRPPPTEREICDLARIAVAQDLPGALAFVESLSSQGVSLESILLHLVAPAARLLGQEWDEDVTNWADVTVGLGTLQQVVHVLGPGFSPGIERRGRVVLVAALGEQHTLGVSLLGEFLRRVGWGVHVEPTMADADLITLVGSESIEMVGITVSNAGLVKPLERLVASIKAASVNPNIAVMLGGSPELADDAGRLDATFCAGPHDAVRWLERNAKSGSDEKS